MSLFSELHFHFSCRAHAAAYRAYQADFLASQNGKVGISLNINWAEPRDPASSEDIQSQETYMQFNLGWFAHPIFVDGKYPEVVFLLPNHLSETNQNNFR